MNRKAIKIYNSMNSWWMNFSVISFTPLPFSDLPRMPCLSHSPRTIWALPDTSSLLSITQYKPQVIGTHADTLTILNDSGREMILVLIKILVTSSHNSWSSYSISALMSSLTVSKKFLRLQCDAIRIPRVFQKQCWSWTPQYQSWTWNCLSKKMKVLY